MISIICVYNNEETLEKHLLRSLKEQNTDYELILIDNTKNKFKSASEALNHGGNKSKEKYILFSHQDINLLSKDFLKELEKTLDMLPDFGIAGVAGKSEKEKVIISNIKEGDPPKFSGKIQINEPVTVQTVDECLFVIPKRIFNNHKFDEKVCNGWHLYAVDYCLSVLEQRMNVYVIPASIYHRSAGESFSSDYYSILKKILRKHKDYKRIYTTFGNWNSVYPLSIQKILQRSIYYWTKFRRKL